jgi:hypothetical protein
MSAGDILDYAGEIADAPIFPKKSGFLMAYRAVA